MTQKIEKNKNGKHKNIKNSVKTELYKNPIVTEVYTLSPAQLYHLIIAKSSVSDD